MLCVAAFCAQFLLGSVVRVNILLKINAKIRCGIATQATDFSTRFQKVRCFYFSLGF
jgi:hypothetical protein